MEQQQLFRVRVLLSDDKAIDVGPAMVQECAQHFCDAILKQIKLGKEKTWKDPIIYPIYD